MASTKNPKQRKGTKAVPPKPDAAPRWRGQFAEHLLAQYRDMKRGRRKRSRRAETALKYEALDMLEEMGAPPSVLELFDTLLGGVVAAWEADEPARRWIGAAIAYEARALRRGRDVTDAEIADAVFLPTKPRTFSRRTALREVRATRQGDWYRAMVLSRQYGKKA